MQVREGTTQRFSLARDQAVQVVRSLGPLDEVMLISVAARPRVVSGFTTDHRVFLHLLESLRPEDSPTNLDLGVELALAQRDRAGQRASVHVFTDVPQTQLSLPQDQLAQQVYHGSVATTTISPWPPSTCTRTRSSTTHRPAPIFWSVTTPHAPSGAA